MITTYVPEGEILPVMRHKLIFENYKKEGSFYSDIIAIIPIIFILDCSRNKFYRLLYLIKIIRIYKTLSKINII